MKNRIIPWGIAVCGLGAIGSYIADLVGRMNAIDIIGGADGPTFLFLTQSGPAWLAVIGVAAVLVGVVLLLKKK